MSTDRNKLIGDAEKEITSILAKLEVDTGMVIDHLTVRDIEVTAMEDDRPQWLRRLTIEMMRIPGTRWN